MAEAGQICVSKSQQMATQEPKVQNYYANCMEVNGNIWILRCFTREVASDFLFLCRHLLKFQNEAWCSFDRLKVGCGAPPAFPLAPLDFEDLALPKVYNFFRWRLYTEVRAHPFAPWSKAWMLPIVCKCHLASTPLTMLSRAYCSVCCILMCILDH